MSLISFYFFNLIWGLWMPSLVFSSPGIAELEWFKEYEYQAWLIFRFCLSNLINFQLICSKKIWGSFRFNCGNDLPPCVRNKISNFIHSETIYDELARFWNWSLNLISFESAHLDRSLLTLSTNSPPTPSGLQTRARCPNILTNPPDPLYPGEENARGATLQRPSRTLISFETSFKNTLWDSSLT